MRLRLRQIEFYERIVRFRLPFRFGVVTLTEEPQLFLRGLVEFKDGRTQWGVAAEALVPKWFDKDPSLSNEENFEQLRTSLSLASAFYLSDREWKQPFDLFVDHSGPQLAACSRHRLNPLIAGFGQALLDRAVIDACCREEGSSFFQAVRGNLPGIRVLPILPELSAFDLGRFLEDLEPILRIHARHTIGLLDPIVGADMDASVGDGLPETLEEVIAFYGSTHFKIKLQGDIGRDLDRLCRIASVLDRSDAPYFVTLDGNEQFPDAAAVLDLLGAVRDNHRLRRLASSILLIEQPISRSRALSEDVSRLNQVYPVIIDESDIDLDAFPRARYCGYSGVSSKQCKGVYRSILNAARCAVWNSQGAGSYFMTGEDLTIQGGLALQQDLALASLLGLRHIERNGHHFVRGLADVSRLEQLAFLERHGDLYTDDRGFVRLDIRGGLLRLGSLSAPGLGTDVEPDWSAMRRTR